MEYEWVFSKLFICKTQALRMNKIIVYTSRSGNTELVAKSISDDLDTELIDVKSIENYDEFWKKQKDTELVFIGSGVYANNTSEALIDFLEHIPEQRNLKFAAFATWLGRGKSAQKMIQKLRDIIEEKGSILVDNAYLCYGKSFGLIRRDHPNKDELEQAVIWAKKI